MDQSSGWNTMMEGSQSAADGHIGVEEQKETSEGDYEEVENTFFNTPFAMEYNMSYSMVTQTAM